MTTGCFIIVISFIFDFIYQYFSQPYPMHALTNYIPVKFNWLIFIAGEIILLTGISFYAIRAHKVGGVKV